MSGQKSASPSPTQPHSKNGHVSQRGMLSIVMLLVSLGALGIAMLGGAKRAYDLLGPSDTAQPGLVSTVIALGITYALGWLTAMVAIRVYGNLVLPIILNMLMWVCLAGVCYLYVEILERLYLQKYVFVQFVKD